MPPGFAVIFPTDNVPPYTNVFTVPLFTCKGRVVAAFPFISGVPKVKVIDPPPALVNVMVLPPPNVTDVIVLFPPDPGAVQLRFKVDVVDVYKTTVPVEVLEFAVLRTIDPPLVPGKKLPRFKLLVTLRDCEKAAWYVNTQNRNAVKILFKEFFAKISILYIFLITHSKLAQILHISLVSYLIASNM